MKKKVLFLILCISAMLLLQGGFDKIVSASEKQYVVTSNTKPCNSKFLKFSTYNAKTKDYYMFRSYLEKLEADGGGNLVIKKGHYTISNTLFVPSNVTIRFQNGVRFEKGNATGASEMPAAKSIFQLIPPSKSMKTGVYGKYDGAKNISFLGEGTVIFDLKFDADSIAIIMGHNSNIKVKNIQFQNMKSGHHQKL